MRRFNRGMALRPIHRVKHVIDTSAGNLTANTNVNVILVKGINSPDAITNTNEVAVGSTVNGIYLRVEVSCDTDVTTEIPNVYMSVNKNPGGALSAIVPNTVGTSVNKRFVIHQEMLMMDGHVGGNPRVLFNGVIKIPKGYKRFADTDTLQLRILAPTVALNYCVQCHYKEFR